MSWTYSGNPKDSDVDRYRFISGDTISTKPIMQDEEIQYIIDSCAGNENKVLYNLFSRIAVLYARDVKKSLGPQSEDPTERIKFFVSQAEFYRKKCASLGISLPKSKRPAIFYRDMQSNPPYPNPEGF
jgi:hypothetical protein